MIRNLVVVMTLGLSIAPWPTLAAPGETVAAEQEDFVG